MPFDSAETERPATAAECARRIRAWYAARGIDITPMVELVTAGGVREAAVRLPAVTCIPPAPRPARGLAGKWTAHRADWPPGSNERLLAWQVRASSGYVQGVPTQRGPVVTMPTRSAR